MPRPPAAQNHRRRNRRPTFHYQAEVDNRLPQTSDAAVSFDVTRHVRLDVEGDLTNWATAFPLS